MKALQETLDKAEQAVVLLEQEIATKSTSYQQSKEDFENYQKEIHTYQLKLTGILERADSLSREKLQTEQSIESAATQKQRLTQEVAGHVENIAAQKQKIASFEEKMTASLGSYETQEQSNADLKNKHEKLGEAIREIEANLKIVRKKKEEVQNNVNDVRVSLSEIAVKMENLQNQTHEIYEKSLLDCIAEIQNDENAFELTSENISGYREQRETLKSKVQRFGNVNLAAIDEIEELKERFEFLTTQQQDLEKSLATLMDAIKTINKTTKEKFEVTYNEVNERFQKIFPRLFRGGKARLTMTDPENILETGIDIFAQPPGKKLQNMNLLSGGEKALTAISLLFAIFEYKAPPFCVLDEVDAPLDDANVLRYVAMVKEMSEKTQFIVITHNKGSMQMANNLYGVTMEEPGVSRTVSVRLDQENVHTQETIFEAKSVA
ncbi:MAG: hypothetical protein KDK51_05560 [Deltaproteobacteria bacterium]|nr:hypothetical protein [Deltaproteobacteria bacterium]